MCCPYIFRTKINRRPFRIKNRKGGSFFKSIIFPKSQNSIIIFGKKSFNMVYSHTINYCFSFTFSFPHLSQKSNFNFFLFPFNISYFDLWNKKYESNYTNLISFEFYALDINPRLISHSSFTIVKLFKCLIVEKSFNFDNYNIF